MEAQGRGMVNIGCYKIFGACLCVCDVVRSRRGLGLGEQPDRELAFLYHVHMDVVRVASSGATLLPLSFPSLRFSGLFKFGRDDFASYSFFLLSIFCEASPHQHCNR